MRFLDDGKLVVVNEKEYSVLKELTFTGDVPSGTQRPYLRQGTKVSIYREVMNRYPDVYEQLINMGWFQAYRNDVEPVKQEDVTIKEDGIVPDGVKDMMKDFEKMFDKLGNKVEELNKTSKFEEAMLQGIIDKGKELSVEDIKADLIANLDTHIKEVYGTLPTLLDIQVKEDVRVTTTGIFHEMFESILKLVNMNLPVMLTGGAGAGKNFMLEQVSEALNMSFYYTSTITQEYKLTGFIDGGGKYHETEFYKAFTQGGIFMLDEIDASIPECLVILNGAIANGYFDFPTGRELAHDDFRVVCAGNTVGLVADMVYTGRNVLDGATLDRFVLVKIDYDSRIEEMLCPDKDLRDYLYAFRSAVESNRISHIVGMRTFKYAYELLQNGFDKKFINDSVVTKGLMIDDINNIKRELNYSGSWAKEL